MSNSKNSMRGSTIRTGRNYLGFTQESFIREIRNTFNYPFRQQQLSKIERDVDTSWDEFILRAESSKFLRSRGIDDDLNGNMILIRLGSETSNEANP